MPVIALQHVRRMRGGANSHLLRADDGRYYVVKFRNNPQHERILVNELICYVLLEYLRLPTPAWEIVEVPPELVEATPELTMEVGREKTPCGAGLHFGSCFPGDPARQAVYDYVPVSLLRLVFNVDTFCGVLAFDKWVSNADGRQAIFFRDRAKNWLPPGEDGTARVSPRSLVYVASMIDHGFAFHAHHWEFMDSAELGLYARREVYEAVHGEESFQPWLDRIVNCPPEVLDDAYKRVPPEWLGADWDGLESLLERLYARRRLVPELLRAPRMPAVIRSPTGSRPPLEARGGEARARDARAGETR
jgi:hypothetical protein